MKKIYLPIISLLLLSTVSCNNTPTESQTSQSSYQEVEYNEITYSNPLIVTKDGLDYRSEVADPSIVDGENGYYYIVSTDRKFLKSEDLVTWEVINENIIDVPTWGEGLYQNPTQKYVWAPDLMNINDTWVLYYSLSGTDQPYGIGYATANDIEGPYIDQGKLFTYQEIGINNAIDPQPFLDDDGSLYMVVGSYQGVFILELEEDGQSLFNGVEYQRTNKKLIAGKIGPWDSTTYEGGYIIKKDNKYYFFGSKGKACDKQNSDYEVYVGVSNSVIGPYKDPDGMDLRLSGNGITYGKLVVTSSEDGNLIGPGHNSIFKDDAGEYWIYYHSYYSDDNYSNRHLFLDKLYWDEDGFPYILNQTPSFEEELDGPRMILI